MVGLGFVDQFSSPLPLGDFSSWPWLGSEELSPGKRSATGETGSSSLTWPVPPGLLCLMVNDGVVELWVGHRVKAAA